MKTHLLALVIASSLISPLALAQSAVQNQAAKDAFCTSLNSQLNTQEANSAATGFKLPPRKPRPRSSTAIQPNPERSICLSQD